MTNVFGVDAMMATTAKMAENDRTVPRRPVSQPMTDQPFTARVLDAPLARPLFYPLSSRQDYWKPWI
jgi:hypothetical protein